VPRGKQIKDLTGQRFGRLTVLKFAGRKPSGKQFKTMWLCKCDCGNVKTIASGELGNGTTQSCGCLHKEFIGNLNKSHGLSGNNKRLYKIWKEMRYRCNNPTNKSYERYGGRGIKVCDEWNNNFVSFYKWSIENGYREDVAESGRNRLSLDRIDNDGDYEPSNCRWTTDHIQVLNKRISMTDDERYRVCPICGKKFEVTQRSCPKKYCSINCYQEARRRNAKLQKNLCHESRT